MRFGRTPSLRARRKSDAARAVSLATAAICARAKLTEPPPPGLARPKPGLKVTILDGADSEPEEAPRPVAKSKSGGSLLGKLGGIGGMMAKKGAK